MKIKLIILSIAVLCLSAAPIMAHPFGSEAAADRLQKVLDDITTIPLGDSSVDVRTDYVSDAMDSIWDIGGSGGAVTTMIIELAGNKDENAFGIYDSADSSNRVEVFPGRFRSIAYDSLAG
jgi:hypothetical protein